MGSVGPDVVVPAATRAPTSAVVESDQFVSGICLTFEGNSFCCFENSDLVFARDGTARFFPTPLCRGVRDEMS